MCEAHRKIAIDTIDGLVEVDEHLVELHHHIDGWGWSPPMSCQEDHRGRITLTWFDKTDLEQFLDVVAADGSLHDWSLYHCISHSWWDPAIPAEERDQLETQNYWSYRTGVFDHNDLDRLDGVHGLDQARPHAPVQMEIWIEVAIPNHHLPSVVARLSGQPATADDPSLT